MSSKRPKDNDPIKRPSTSHDFRRPSSRASSRDQVRPPNRSATPAIGSSSRSRSSDKVDKTTGGRGKKPEKHRTMVALAEEDEDEDEDAGGVDLRDPGQRQGAPSTRHQQQGHRRSANRSAFDDGRSSHQGIVVPDVFNSGNNEFTERESRAFWTWDQDQQHWFNIDPQTGEVMWAPRQLA